MFFLHSLTTTGFHLKASQCTRSEFKQFQERLKEISWARACIVDGVVNWDSFLGRIQKLMAKYKEVQGTLKKAQSGLPTPNTSSITALEAELKAEKKQNAERVEQLKRVFDKFKEQKQQLVASRNEIKRLRQQLESGNSVNAVSGETGKQANDSGIRNELKATRNKLKQAAVAFNKMRAEKVELTSKLKQASCRRSRTQGNRGLRGEVALRVSVFFSVNSLLLF